MSDNKETSAVTGDKNYQRLLREVKSIIAQGQAAAYKSIDNIRVQTYWQLGERIVREELENKDRATYGRYLIEKLADDLGFRKRHLYEIVKFYRTYPIVRSVTAQLSWTHYANLIDIDDAQERAFYENKAIINSWSVRDLKKQIKCRLYQNTSQKDIAKVFKVHLSTADPTKVFKDSYHFSFIELLPDKKEKDLEVKILDHFQLFLKELGEDFAIFGRQAPIKIDQETHYIDLVLYHRGIPCIVLVDLKIGKFSSRDVGQMNKYINYYRQNRQYKHEKDTIGLIICRKAGKEEVRYALAGLEEKIFVAEYKLKLPSEDAIERAIRNI